MAKQIIDDTVMENVEILAKRRAEQNKNSFVPVLIRKEKYKNRKKKKCRKCWIMLIN